MYQTIEKNPLEAAAIPAPPPIQELRSALEAFRDLFKGVFDITCFTQALEKTAFPDSTLREIRDMSSCIRINSDNLFTVKVGIEGLEQLIHFSRRYIQPFLRDLLEISGFHENRSFTESARTARTVKSMFASTFPENLDKLEQISFRLREALNSMA